MSDAKELVERARKVTLCTEDGAGTLPAKEAVKLRPADWHAVTSLIKSQAADLARVEGERDKAASRLKATGEEVAAREALLLAAEATIASLREEVGKLRMALEPFGQAAHYYQDEPWGRELLATNSITVGDLRRARALSNEETK